MADAGKKLDRSVFIGHMKVGPLFPNPDRDIPTVRAPDGFNPATPEESYRALVPEGHRKRYGQFFTPPPVAELMCKWIAASRPSEVLDPATGPGVFVRELLQQTDQCRITAVEVDPLAMGAARRAVRQTSRVSFVLADFLTWNSPRRFDGVVANPPYLKHHNFHYGGNIFAEIGRRNGVRLSRLANIYALFILEICRRLKEGGRAAIIVPGEWVNANFGVVLKRYLLANGLLKVLLYFSHHAEIFRGALTTASVLLIEKLHMPRPVDTVLCAYVTQDLSVTCLAPLLEGRTPTARGVFAQAIPTRTLLAAKKWDYLLKTGAPESAKGFITLSQLAETKRGIATGANRFFHIEGSTASANGLRHQRLLKCIGRASDVRSLVFKGTDFDDLVARGKRAYLLDLRPPLAPHEERYVAKGEAEDLPKRYLLAARAPWYTMERRTPSPIWAAVFGRKGLRFVWNAANVRNLTAFHCIYPESSDPLFIKALVAVLNSRRIQDLSKRQRRVYGGGLSKFEPRDLLDIQVPDLRTVSRSILRALSSLLDRIDTALRDEGAVPNAEWDELDKLVSAASGEAASARAREPSSVPRGLSQVSLPSAPRTHRVAPAE